MPARPLSSRSSDWDRHLLETARETTFLGGLSSPGPQVLRNQVGQRLRARRPSPLWRSRWDLGRLGARMRQPTGNARAATRGGRSRRGSSGRAVFRGGCGQPGGFQSRFDSSLSASTHVTNLKAGPDSVTDCHQMAAFSRNLFEIPFQIR